MTIVHDTTITLCFLSTENTSKVMKSKAQCMQIHFPNIMQASLTFLTKYSFAQEHDMQFTSFTLYKIPFTAQYELEHYTEHIYNMLPLSKMWHLNTVTLCVSAPFLHDFLVSRKTHDIKLFYTIIYAFIQCSLLQVYIDLLFKPCVCTN